MVLVNITQNSADPFCLFFFQDSSSFFDLLAFWVVSHQALCSRKASSFEISLQPAIGRKKKKVKKKVEVCFSLYSARAKT